MKAKTARIVAIISPVTGVVSFLTLGNRLVVADDSLNSVGLSIALLSLVVFTASLAVLMVAWIARQTGGNDEPARAAAPTGAPTPVPHADRVPARAKASAPAPHWYRSIKLLTGLVIVLGLFPGVPIGMYLLYFGPAIDPLTMLLFLLTALPILAMPIPFGIFVWPLAAIGALLVLSHRKQWVVLDGILSVLTVLIILGFKTIITDGSLGKQGGVRPAESIGGTETVRVTASNGEGGGTAGAGLCISASVQPPHDNLPDMRCGVTGTDGKLAFEVKPGRYYILLDLRSRDEFDFDPKYPNGYVEWEVLPQSTNQLEFMVTRKR